jgi:serine/tyrosine/threonine adenylyltransferase
MRRHNPSVIPRNHKVEEALDAATAGHDLTPMERLLQVLAAPYDYDRDLPEFVTPARDQRPYRTFCGT